MAADLTMGSQGWPGIHLQLEGWVTSRRVAGATGVATIGATAWLTVLSMNLAQEVVYLQVQVTVSLEPQMTILLLRTRPGWARISR